MEIVYSSSSAEIKMTEIKIHRKKKIVVVAVQKAFYFRKREKKSMKNFAFLFLARHEICH